MNNAAQLGTSSTIIFIVLALVVFMAIYPSMKLRKNLNKANSQLNNSQAEAKHLDELKAKETVVSENVDDDENGVETVENTEPQNDQQTVNEPVLDEPDASEPISTDADGETIIDVENSVNEHAKETIPVNKSVDNVSSTIVDVKYGTRISHGGWLWNGTEETTRNIAISKAGDGTGIIRKRTITTTNFVDGNKTTEIVVTELEDLPSEKM